MQSGREKIILFEEKNLEMPYRFAKCCSADTARPKPDILGIVTRVGIVSIHRKDCGMTKAANSERKVRVKWA